MAGFQNNPLKKFPLAIHPPGSSSRIPPGGQGGGFNPTAVGPISHAPHQQLTPLGARTKMFSGFKSPFNK